MWPTEVRLENDKRDHIDCETGEFSENHDEVPGMDSQRHHEELGKEDWGEGDGDYMDEVRVEEQQCAVHYYSTYRSDLEYSKPPVYKEMTASERRSYIPASPISMNSQFMPQ